MHIFQHLEDRNCCDSMKYEFTKIETRFFLNIPYKLEKIP